MLEPSKMNCGDLGRVMWIAFPELTIDEIRALVRGLEDERSDRARSRRS